MKFIKIGLYLSFLCLTACGGGSSQGNSSSAAAETPSSSSSLSSSLASSSPSSSSSLVASSSSSSSSSVATISSSSSSAASATFTLNTTSFDNGATIPQKYSCDGIDINPQLSWQGVPAGTKSFVLIVDDPDAFAMFGVVWVHWNVYNISPSATELAEGASTHADLLPPGTVEATSDFGSAKYRGPCPPSGRHQYHFQLYALNKDTISFSGPLTRTEFEAAYGGDIIDKALITGYFR